MAQRNIVIKSFNDVPMADVEMIFPEKKVFIKPFILIQLVATVVLAIFTIITTVVQVGNPTSHPSVIHAFRLRTTWHTEAASVLFIIASCLLFIT